MFNKLKWLILDNLPTLFAILVVTFSLILISKHANAAEWNDKPIMCGTPEETNEAIQAKEEELIFKATQTTKIRSETGLAKNPVALRMDMYVNPTTGTYTIIEYHPSYESTCVISFGTNFQVFIGGVQ